MIFYENDSTDPFFNLAAEEVLLNEPDPSIRLWQNDPAIVVGRHQNTLQEINSDSVEKFGVKVVRRLTGGGAVYHDQGNLNFTFIVPDPESSFHFNFKIFTEPVVRALDRLGIHARLSGRNDLLIGDKKFSGNAQAKIKGKILHHGTLLFNTDLTRIPLLLNVSPDKIRSHAVESVRSRVVNIADCLPIDVSAPINSISSLSSSLPAGYLPIVSNKNNSDSPLPAANILSFRNYLAEELIRNSQAEIRSISAAQSEKILKLRTEKYSTWNWNFGQSPVCDFHRKKKFDWGELEAGLVLKKGHISKLYFFGDFFPLKAPETLAEKLISLPFDRETILNSLSDKDIHAVFPALSIDAFLDFLIPGN